MEEIIIWLERELNIHLTISFDYLTISITLALMDFPEIIHNWKTDGVELAIIQSIYYINL